MTIFELLAQNLNQGKKLDIDPNSLIQKGTPINLSSNQSTQQPVQQSNFLQKAKEALLGIGEKWQNLIGAQGETIGERALGAAKTIGTSAYNLAKDITLTYPSRTAGSIFLDIANALNLTGKKEIVPETPVEKFFWGNEPVKAFSQKLEESIPVGGAIGQSLLGKPGAALGKTIAPFVVGGMAILDLVPFGGSEKKLGEELLKTKTAEEAAGILRKTKIPEEIISKYAPKFAATQKINEVSSILSEMTKELKSISGVVESLAEEARKYKSAEEFIDAVNPKHMMDLSPGKQWGRAIPAIEEDIGSDFFLPLKDFYELYWDTVKNTEVAPYLRDLPFKKTITIYRGVPKGVKEIRIGDWVTLRPDYAKSHIGEEGGRVLKKEVPIEDIIWKGGDWNEFVYSPQKIRELVGNLTDFYNQVVKEAKEVKPVVEEIKPEETIKKLNQILKDAKVLRGKQEVVYTQERAKKLAKMIDMSKDVGGEEGYIARLAALKGEMKKVNFESIADKFSKEERDQLFNLIWQNPHLDEWEKVSAAEGLTKLLGVEGGRIPTMGELEKLSYVFPEDTIKAILSKRGGWSKFGNVIMQVYNLPRTLMAGVLDLSGTLLQNVMFAFRHPIITAKNFIEEVKMFGSEKYYQTVMNDILNRDNYILYKKAGIQLTDVGPILRQREETFMAPFIEKIPGIGSIVRATGRAWTGFLNKMRADVADKIIESAKLAGGKITDEKFLKSLGYLINAATGRGQLGKLEKIAPILGQGFFSARKLAATVQMINPVFYIKADPLVRKEALKTWLAFLGGGATILGLAKMAGAEVGVDPNSADFGKIKIGNTRFNIWGSYQQLAVLFSRLISGKMISSTTGRITELGEGYKPMTRFDIIFNFFETKEHPTLSYILGLLRGVDQIGQKFNWKPELISRFIPMVFSDMYDIYKEHGPVGLLGVIPIVLGVPTQTYGAVELTKGINQLGQPTIELQQRPRLEDVLAGQQLLSPSTKGQAEVFVKQLMGMSKEEAAPILDQIEKENPDLLKTIHQVFNEYKRGITPDDQLLLQKGIKNGERAKAIVKKLKKAKTKEEAGKILDDYIGKGIINEQVLTQIKLLLQQK